MIRYLMHPVAEGMQNKLAENDSELDVAASDSFY